MKNLVNNLQDIKAVIVPTCDSFDFPNSEDLKRANTAIKFVEENNIPKRCIIAGLGPDTNLALGFGDAHGKKEFDFHKNLYDYLMNNTDWKIGVDINSVNSIENILYTFPKGTEGKYAIVSFPLHLKRFEKIVKDAKSAGRISEDLDIVYVPTSQKLKWFAYEVLSNIKYHTLGKKKYFSKKQQ